MNSPMKVVSDARKLIFMPPANAPVVEFPEGAVISEYGANNKTPSVVVMNGTEKPPTWQGVDHETGSVIINGVPGDVALEALADYAAGGFTIETLHFVLGSLAVQGYNDQYTTPRKFIETQLSPAGLMIDRYTGIVQRSSKDLKDCWREGSTFYVNPNGEPRLIQPDILVRDYRNADGSLINLAEIPDCNPVTSS